MQNKTNFRLAALAGFLAILVAGAAPAAAAQAELKGALDEQAAEEQIELLAQAFEQAIGEVPAGVVEADGLGYAACLALLAYFGALSLSWICSFAGSIGVKWCKSKYSAVDWRRYVCYAIV